MNNFERSMGNLGVVVILASLAFGQGCAATSHARTLASGGVAAGATPSDRVADTSLDRQGALDRVGVGAAASEREPASAAPMFSVEAPEPALRHAPVAATAQCWMCQ